MKVFNKNKKILLAENLQEAKTFSDRFLGLLKKSNTRGSIFRTRFGIHTFFMKESIDVIVLDNNFKVVKIATVGPNKSFFWNPRYSQVLELPRGSVKQTRTKVSDKLKLIP